MWTYVGGHTQNRQRRHDSIKKKEKLTAQTYLRTVRALAAGSFSLYLSLSFYLLNDNNKKVPVHLRTLFKKKKKRGATTLK